LRALPEAVREADIVTARDLLLASLSPELVAAFDGLLDERFAEVGADRDVAAWPEWINIEAAARYLDCAPERSASSRPGIRSRSTRSRAEAVCSFAR
jgi:hypothetical protein